VFETQGEAASGLAWLARRRRGFTRLNNFFRHLAWHEALFRLARGEFDAVLALYDGELRAERTDDYRDVANAASLLWRLERRGIRAGDRWEELADIAERRVQDSALVFASLHYLLSLKGAGREPVIAEMLARMRRGAGAKDDTQSRILSEVGLPLAEIVAAPERIGDEAAAIGVRLARIGGSGAQRQVFHMVLADAERSATAAVLQAQGRARAA
jgi:hypothetical protein